LSGCRRTGGVEVGEAGRSWTGLVGLSCYFQCVANTTLFLVVVSDLVSSRLGCTVVMNSLLSQSILLLLLCHFGSLGKRLRILIVDAGTSQIWGSP
jgi:amino acid permease